MVHAKEILEAALKLTPEEREELIVELSASLNAEFANATKAKRVQEIFATNAAETMHVSPPEMQKAMERDAKEWAAVVKATGVVK